MKRIFLFIFTVFLLSSFVRGETSICIDLDSPEAPQNLGLVVSGNNIQLSWDKAIDIPDCSDIDYYNIYRDNNLINTTENLTYSDTNLGDGTYAYKVSAVDLARNEGEFAEGSISITTFSPTGGGRRYRPPTTTTIPSIIPPITGLTEDEGEVIVETGEGETDTTEEKKGLEGITGVFVGAGDVKPGVAFAIMLGIITLGILGYFLFFRKR